MPRLIRRAAVMASLPLCLLALAPVAAHAQGAASPTPSPQGAPVTPAEADEVKTQTWAYHLQSTFTEQFSPGFPSKYSGPQSLPSYAEGRETIDATAYLGVRPWSGAEIWFDPEIDQGYGLGDSFGVAGFLSGEAYKNGANDPYFLIQRLFLRQTIDMGGEVEKVDPDLNVLGGTQSANRIVITAGKISVVDIFDTNKYAHDPRNDFLNWSVLDAGTFDYVANAWGYTYGGAVEIYRDGFAARFGAFNFPATANGKNIDPRILSQFQLVGELEESHTVWNQPGKVRVLYFFMRGDQGTYNDALALAAATGATPATTSVRSYRNKDGVVLNVEQQIVEDLGFFLRAGASQGGVEENSFTDIDKTLSTGLSLSGNRWHRDDDTVGAAFVVNTISHAGKDYLAAGGLGGIIGDGALVNSGPEQIFEAYYSAQIVKGLNVTGDYQLVNHPAYNRDRGPVNAIALRLHAQF
jgi:high affinity Mn2+ porin